MSSKYDPDEPFSYEGRGCWVVAAIAGAVGMALLMALVCLVWRGAVELGWMRFDGQLAIGLMLVASVMGLPIGAAEHYDTHRMARYAAQHPETAHDDSDEDEDESDGVIHVPAEDRLA